MHEISIVRSVIDAMKGEVEKHKHQRISRIRVRIGRLKAVEPESFSFHFSALSKGTAFEDAALDFDIIEPKAKCTSCQGIFEIGEVSPSCPMCGSETIEVVGGNELLIDEYEAE